MTKLPDLFFVAATAGSGTCLPVPVVEFRNELAALPTVSIWARMRAKIRRLSPLPDFDNITFSLTEAEILEDLGYNRD